MHAPHAMLYASLKTHAAASAQVANAYEILSDRDKRSAYDQVGGVHV
jgi:DnaJ-class molecular chaperone